MQRPDSLIAPAPMLGQALASRVAAACHQSVAARGAFHIAVTGGSLLTLFGAVLSGADADWGRTHAVRDVLEGPGITPLALVLHHAVSALVLADPAAAARLSGA